VALTLSSPAFAHGQEIPRQYTCEGLDTSPPLRWSGVPPNAQSLALIVEDPDAPDPAAPRRVFTHWLLYNIPADAEELREEASPEELPAGTAVGVNDFDKLGWGGPCPPKGRHRYFFRLYALDRRLPNLHQPTKRQLLDALRGHVIAEAELIGTYQKH
jgi:Raf kinase inhibitor-like YbhB/YbcL family protein